MTIWQVMILVSEAIPFLSSSILPQRRSPRLGSTTDHALAETRGTTHVSYKDESNERQNKRSYLQWKKLSGWVVNTPPAKKFVAVVDFEKSELVSIFVLDFAF